MCSPSTFSTDFNILVDKELKQEKEKKMNQMIEETKFVFNPRR
jgi:hypothetical protein